MAEITVVVQTLKTDRYELKVNMSDTVEVLKQKISGLALSPAIPATSMRVIHTGNILDDDSVTLEAAGLSESNNLLVVMKVRKPKNKKGKKKKKQKQQEKNTEPAPEAKEAKATTAEPAATESDATPTTTESTATPMETSESVDTPAPEAKAETESESSSNASSSAADAMVVGDELGGVIAQLMTLGDYSVEQCKAALRAAFNNPNTAAEYLIMGIPANLQQQQQQQQGTPSGGPPQGNSMAPMGGMGAAMDTGNGGGGSEQAEAANFMQMLQQNPQMMQMMMAIQSNPELQAQVQQNPEALLQMMAMAMGRGRGGPPQGMGGMGGMGAPQGMGGMGSPQGGHGGPPPGATTIRITEDERQKIENLQGLAPGISQQMALEAFLACDRNYEMAANYLLDQMFQ